MIRRFLLLATVAPLLAGASIDSRMPTDPKPFNVRGGPAFCRDNRDICMAAGADRVEATDDLRAHLTRVNAAVNAAIRYRADSDDRWALSPAVGDCEDFAATKLARLIAAGMPRRALRLAVVQAARTEIAMNGQPFTVWRWHMVLTVETTAGTLVLDSLRAAVTEWQPTPDRTWIALEAPQGGRMAFVRLATFTGSTFEEGR